MNYKDYFPNLTKLEERLYDEGYWELGFVDNVSKTIPITNTNSEKYAFLIDVVLFTKTEFLIKESDIIYYLDNPNEVLKIRKKIKKIASAKRYRNTKTINTKPNKV